MEQNKQNAEVLSFEALKEANEQYTNLTEIYIQLDNGKTVNMFKVGIYKVFSPVQIANFTKEFISRLDQIRVKFLGKRKLQEIMMPYLMFCAIKHFTTVKLPDKLEEQLLSIEYLQNHDVLFEIYNQFDEKELDKVNANISEIMKTFSNNEDILAETMDEYKDKFVDKSFLELASD